MKILHVLRAPVGGLFRHVVDLAHGQIARGHDVGLVVDSRTANGLSEAALAALTPKLALGLSRYPIFRQPGPADFAAVLHVARRIGATGAEFVHGHGAKGGALARLAPAHGALIRAYTPHGGSLHDAVGGRICILMEKALKRRGQLYLFESTYSRDTFHRKIGRPAGTVRVVHNGVGRDELAPVALDPDAVDVVVLGEMRALKGVDVLIYALAHSRRLGRRLTAALIGAGPDAASFRELVETLGLQGLVTFHKPMPTRAALAQGRVVVLPSRAESLPYVVLEAAAASKPLVATRVGGVPEVFGPFADRLVAPDDVAALAKAIADAVDGAADATAQALRLRVEKAFSVDAMVEAVLGAYQQASLGRQPSAARSRAGVGSPLTTR
jgi:glycosyltransferase involved in cell wall biosynthesis